ncbi:hypothetical protein CF335_g9120, partial [Tilletia laevis]
WILKRRDKVGGSDVAPAAEASRDTPTGRRADGAVEDDLDGIVDEDDRVASALLAEDAARGRGTAGFSEDEAEEGAAAGNARQISHLDDIGRMPPSHLLIWRHRHDCDHGGKPEPSKRNTDLSPSKKRKRLPSIKVNCRARFVSWQRLGDDRIFVKWSHAHSGHTVTSIASMAESRLPARVRHWIRDRVSEGRDWKAIRNLLRLDEGDLERLEKGVDGLEMLPEALRVKRMDVYNELRKQLLKVARKATDRKESLQKWAVEIEEEGGMAAVKTDIPCAVGEATWAACFMTSWQKQMLLMHGHDSIVSLDATHNTCFGFEHKEKVWLYSLVVRSSITGRGIPAAFMLTNGEHAQPIVFWLQALRRDPRVRFIPKQIMIDCSSTELSAIRMAYPPDNLPTVLFCDWHMLKAMSDQSKKKVRGHSQHTRGAQKIAANQLAQKEARESFIVLMNAPDQAAFETQAAAYLQTWSCCPAWQAYIQKEWLPQRAMWARAWRTMSHRGVDTNNFIESWHNQLKSVYLGLMRKQGVDVLLWFLLKQCIQDHRASELRVCLGLQSCALSKADRDAKKHADAVTFSNAQALVVHDTDDSIT